MSLLINNELIWVSIPKCASISIEQALTYSNLNIKRVKGYNDMISLSRRYSKEKNPPPYHAHVRKSILFDDFGKKDTVRIKRDWFKRWVSALQHLLETIEGWRNYTLVKKWEEVDNDYIYNFFDDDYLELLHVNETNTFDECFLKFVHETEPKENVKPETGIVCSLLSQNYWVENEPCTHEFDINEMHLFEKLLYEKYGEKINIKKLNQSSNVKSKIIIDDKLKEWVWNKFESRYSKKNSLL